MRKWLFVSLSLLGCSINAFGDSSIEGLLNTIEKKSDLSEKTKLENSGFSTIYTRNDLDMMQVKYLSDIYKYTMDGYRTSRYGLPDPLTYGPVPFSSSMIRVFIDDQEITTAMYGSGMVILGDLDLGFADHIEVYNLSTSFVYSSEPTSTLIRIFSKKADRDAGGSVKGIVTSRGGSTQNVQYIGKENETDYLARISSSYDKRKEYETSKEDLDRDVKRYNLFTSIKDDTQSVLINASKTNKGGWVGPSADASLDTSKIESEDSHIGYSKTFDDLKFSLAYDGLKDHARYKDSLLFYQKGVPINSIESKATSSALSAELKYNTTLGDHHIITGAKYRYKMIKFDFLQMNGVDVPQDGHTRQSIGSLFVEDSYAFADNIVGTLGAQSSNVDNNGGYENEDVQMLRAGITYTNDQWTSKSFVFHTESYIEPYLIGSFYMKSVYPEKMTLDSIAQEFKYEDGPSLYEFFISYAWIQDAPYVNANMRVDTADATTTHLSSYLQYTYQYDAINKITLAYRYKEIDHAGYHQEFRNHQVILRNQNRYHKFDFFEEMFVTRSEYYDNAGFDLTLGVRYNISDNLIVSLKGQNLLNKAEKQTLSRFDFTTFTPMEPLKIPIQERIVMLGVEWLF
ncbi:TonB-dependent receptor [Sulfurospirillum sp. UCH001]|uniref:TonB-dependent receptor n=1 Tax=Sulfurospirillum sp. UCH001 TaxID=1581011 RepID=UPI000834A89C|nr:TonB-dependent receptor [Sulfurospirillum sp. UCH001]